MASSQQIGRSADRPGFLPPIFSIPSVRRNQIVLIHHPTRTSAPGAMNYPPIHNGRYHPQYLPQHQQQQHLPQQQQPFLPPPQLLYNNANSNPSPYQYGQPAVHPQTMIPPYPAYADSYSNINDNNIQQRHRQPEQPRQFQYVNPAELYQQTPLPTPPRPHFTHGPQLDGRAPIPAGSNHPHAPTMATAAQVQHPNHNAATPRKLTAHDQPSYASSNSPQARAQTTPVALTPSRPIPQVLIPAPSPEIKKEMQQRTPKKQLQRQTKPPSANKPSKPSIDYQILLLSLADEYLNAAHNHGTMVALERQEVDVEEYYKLVATGLGCLEAVLKVRPLS